jgi:hypothetical protein
MRRWIVGGLLLVVGCGRAPLAWRIIDVPAQAAVVLYELRPCRCDETCEPAFSRIVLRGEEAMGGPEELEPGDYCASAHALSRPTCEVLASDSGDVTFPATRGEIELALSPAETTCATDPALCARAGCLPLSFTPTLETDVREAAVHVRYALRPGGCELEPIIEGEQAFTSPVRTSTFLVPDAYGLEVVVLTEDCRIAAQSCAPIDESSFGAPQPVAFVVEEQPPYRSGCSQAEVCREGACLDLDPCAELDDAGECAGDPDYCHWYAQCGCRSVDGPGCPLLDCYARASADCALDRLCQPSDGGRCIPRGSNADDHRCNTVPNCEDELCQYLGGRCISIGEPPEDWGEDPPAPSRCRLFLAPDRCEADGRDCAWLSCTLRNPGWGLCVPSGLAEQPGMCDCLAQNLTECRKSDPMCVDESSFLCPEASGGNCPDGSRCPSFVCDDGAPCAGSALCLPRDLTSEEACLVLPQL